MDVSTFAQRYACSTADNLYQERINSPHMKNDKRVTVFLRSQNPKQDPPLHRCKKQFASTLVTSNFARWLNKDRTAIVLLTAMSWQQVKDYFRRDLIMVPVILPPRQPETLLLFYPMNPQTTNGKAEQERLWLSATNF